MELFTNKSEDMGKKENKENKNKNKNKISNNNGKSLFGGINGN